MPNDSMVSTSGTVGLDGKHRAALDSRFPFISTVQAPQLVVSQPMWVPVSVQLLANEMDQ